MPFNGTGTFTLAQPAFTPNSTISSASVNSDLSDIVTNGLSKCVVVDGQNPITGQLKFPSGTAALPSFTFATDLTTGMYYVGTKKLGFSAGGVAAVFVDQNNVGSGQTGNQFYYANGAILTPVGSILDFAGPTAELPPGWLFCFGQNLATVSYPELSKVLTNGGISFPWGNPGGGNFTMPDLRGEVTAGRDDMGGVAANRITVGGSGISGVTLGAAGGASTVTLLLTDLPNANVTTVVNITDLTHFHGVGINAAGVGLTTGAAVSGSSSATATATAGGAAQATSSNITATGTTRINGNQGQTAFSKVQPTVITNKIIFAGRP